MRRARGFTLVELLVSLFALAVMAGLSWRGLDGMMRARQQVEARADDVLTLQAGLGQWAADLDAIVEYAPAPALQWNGRVLRLTRRSSLSATDGARVVAWTRREGRWLRWESASFTSRGDLDLAWNQADLWSQNPSEAVRAREVAITPLEDWQIYFYRCNAWTNPLSSAVQCTTSATAPPPATGASGATPPPAGAAPSALPDGVRLVMQLPPGRALSGRLQRDWVRGARP